MSNRAYIIISTFPKSKNHFLDNTFQSWIIKKELCGIKVLANGELDKKLTIKAQRFSTKAVTKIENAGGKAEVI